jgi:sulfite exporter TauE/SafE
MTLAIAGRALVLGLSTGLFCVGFCVPLLGPVMLAREKDGFRESAASIGLFLVGRLAAYLVFGFVFGALGGVLTRIWSIKTVLLPVLYALLGILMILYGIIQSFPHIGFCRALNPRIQSRWYLLVIGFLAGINICPPFLLAITTAMDIGGALQGMFFFFVFFIATSVYLLPLLFSSFVSRFKEVRFAARIAAVLAGLYFIFLAARTVFFRSG